MVENMSEKPQEKETDNTSEEVIVEEIESPHLGELFQIYDKMIHYCCDVSSNHKETQQDVRKIFLAINELTKRFSFLDSLKSTPQEIAEIVNKAISSYNESNNQTNKELNLYHTQIIQMFKDLIENVNKLNNKVDRLESIISQKKEQENKQQQEEQSIISQKKEEEQEEQGKKEKKVEEKEKQQEEQSIISQKKEEQQQQEQKQEQQEEQQEQKERKVEEKEKHQQEITTIRTITHQSTIQQTFANGLHSSKKVYINNISNEDLECKEDYLLIIKKDNNSNNNKITQNDEAKQFKIVDQEYLNDNDNNKKDKITPQDSTIILEDINQQQQKKEQLEEEEKLTDEHFNNDDNIIYKEESINNNHFDNNNDIHKEESSNNKQSTTKKQIIIDSSYIDKARVINKEEDKKENIDELLKKVNKNINKSKVSESYKKLDLKTVMKASRETTIIKYKEKVGNDYTKEQFKNNTEIGIGCKHRIFLRSDGRITNLNKDIIFNKDIKLEKNTYYIEREGQKYLVFRNINSINNNIPNDSFTLMKLPEGCQKFDNDIIVDILNKVRIGGIDGENSILIDSIEELQGLVVADEKIKNRYFDEAKNRRVCSLLSSGDLMKTYTNEFEKGCKENEIIDYVDYMPANNGQLEFRNEKEIDNGMYVKPYVDKVENLLNATKEIQENMQKVESESLLGLQATPTKTEQLSQLKDMSETFYELENNNQEIDLIF